MQNRLLEHRMQGIKGSSGIPQSFMRPVADPSVKGAMVTPAGHYAVSKMDE